MPAVVCHLSDDVGRRAKSINPEALGLFRQDQRAVTDETGAQQGGCMGIIIEFRQSKTTAFVRQRILVGIKD